MASPAPSALSADAPPTKAQEQITFRFCRECSNMLYPKEDRMTNKLMFACRTCQFSEEAISSCVFRNNMYNTVGETAGVTQDVGSDPTVCDPDFNVYGSSPLCCFCTLCGMVLGVEEEEENHECRDKWVDVNVFDPRQLRRLEDEDEEMDSELDTATTTTHPAITAANGKTQREPQRADQLSLSPKPQKRKKPS